MKDTKFVELLNLYLDHQISETEAAQLEAEIRSNPARHRLYRQYCQMQKACTLLTEQFCAEAPAKTSMTAAARQRPLAMSFFYAAGLAAAACVAVLVINRPGDAVTGPALATNVTPMARGVAPAPSPVVQSEEMSTVFTTQALAQIPEPTVGQALFADAVTERYDWMNQVRLQPVQSVPVVFESKPEHAVDRDTFRSRRPFQATVEMTAFQFQK